MKWRIKRIFQVASRAIKLLLLLLFSPVVILFPRNRTKILFGAWGGKQYSCNPKYLFEHMVKIGGLDCIWIGDSSLKESVLTLPGAKFAPKGSLLALWHSLTASFYVCNVNWRGDIINMPRCRRVELFYLTHGYADKNVGIKQFNGRGVVGVKKAPFQWCRDILLWIENFLYGYQSWCSESSEQGISIRLSNQPFIMSKERMLRFGKPRADYFIKNRDNASEKLRCREKIATLLGLPLDKKWYVYVPTWRHNVSHAFSFSKTERKQEFEATLSARNAIIIEKQHPLVLRNISLNFGWHGCVNVLSPNHSRSIDTQELLMASDLLITDYSSVYYDFVLLNRPVIHFAYDFDRFMNVDMGFNFDIRDYGGGPFVYTEDELLLAMTESGSNLLAQRSNKTVPEHLTYERGIACESYVRLILSRINERGFFVR